MITEKNPDSTLNMKDRIKEIMIENRLTAARFAEKIGVPKSGISHILSGRNNPSLDYISKILDVFPYIDSEWLILGRERKSNYKSLEVFPMVAAGIQPKIEKLNQKIEEQKGTLTRNYLKNPEISLKENEDNNIGKEILLKDLYSTITDNKNPEFKDSGLDVQQIVVFYKNGTYKVIVP